VKKLWRVTENGFGKPIFCGGFVVDTDLDRVIIAAPFLYKRVIGKTEVQALQAVLNRLGTKVEQVPITTRSDG
jgi:hypothetical protein